ncbi:MAG TPA: GGDEF domain-containing protein [Arenimonas sp.]|nr:GGDEF domain-containing protein [Arenimonas sp.]
MYRRIVWLALLLLGLPMSGALASDVGIEPQLAVAQAPEGTRLADILSGQAMVGQRQIGFTPLLTPGAPLRLHEDESTWVRLRAELPARSEGEWVLRIERTHVPSARLYFPADPDEIQGEFGFFVPETRPERAAEGFRVPVPAGAAGPMEWYLEVRGDLRVGLLPTFMPMVEAEALDRSRAQWLNWILYGLGIVAALSLYRAIRHPVSGAGGVAFAAVTLMLGCMAFTGGLFVWPQTLGLMALGPIGLWALLLLPCGPLLLATATYSGLPYSIPKLVPYVRGIGMALPALAMLMLVLREDLVPILQVLLWIFWVLLGLASVVVLLMDSRTYRWGPILLWLVLVTALWLRVASEMQLLQATGLTLYGFQGVLLLMLATMLALPWIRSALQQRGAQKRKLVVEPSQAEKIAEARERLLASLQSGLGSAAEGDVQWIAFRRLLAGLKPVLPQLSSAVVAMNYYGEDLMQVDPPDAEERYRLLLADRSSLLRGLSRSRGAQQVSMDFDGPEGPLPPVQLAVIPLPIDKPGWGVLLVERVEGVNYSDEELDLCTEFASLATTASEEAAVAARDKREAEIDPETGVYRSALIQQMLAEQIRESQLRGRPVTVMRVEIDGMADVRSQGDEAAAEALRKIGVVLRDELEFGEALGRLGPDTFLMVLHGRNAAVCRPIADRIISAMAKLGLPMEVQPCIGISELRRGESAGGALIERAASAVVAARRSGTPSSA